MHQSPTKQHMRAHRHALHRTL